VYFLPPLSKTALVILLLLKVFRNSSHQLIFALSDLQLSQQHFFQMSVQKKEFFLQHHQLLEQISVLFVFVTLTLGDSVVPDDFLSNRKLSSVNFCFRRVLNFL
jgi:hypothetical protein